MTESERRLWRELRILRGYVLVSTLGLGVLALSAFRHGTSTAKFDQIDVHRINVREPDGALRMVISDKAESPGPIDHGKPFAYKGGNRPGIIFFNNDQSEDGGLIFDGKTVDGKPKAGAQLSFDQYDQDQVVYLRYDDVDGQRTMGLHVADRADVPLVRISAQLDSIDDMPDGPAKTEARRRLLGLHDGKPLFAPRVFVGRDAARAATLVLSDPMGRPRLRLSVDSTGAPSIEFLGAKGRVERTISVGTVSPAR